MIFSDGQSLSIDYITSCFEGSRCEHLKGKPKLFIIQACQTCESMLAGKDIESLFSFSMMTSLYFPVSDEMSEDVQKEKVHVEGSHTDKADMLIAYATVPGNMHNTNVQKMLKSYLWI